RNAMSRPPGSRHILMDAFGSTDVSFCSMDNITIRRATSADIDAVATLFDSYRVFYGNKSDLNAARSFLTERVRRSESVVFIAHDDGTPAGFTQLYPSFSSVSIAPIYILNDLYVDAVHRRRGIGALLLSFAVQFAKAEGAVRLMLTTAYDNLTAQRLYEAEGWVRDEHYFTYNFVL
ncbi:MAG TPA: GNAT family N-acetyltransferase, partial [Spirochaetia bacterium]|nr:GNAT family N-acetyltransferase [Spirochaetia bacterium]